MEATAAATTATAMKGTDAPTFLRATAAHAITTATHTSDTQKFTAPSPATMMSMRLSMCVGAVVIDVGSA